MIVEKQDFLFQLKHWKSFLKFQYSSAQDDPDYNQVKFENTNYFLNVQRDAPTTGVHKLPHLLCVGELGLEFLSSQFALVHLALQALHALSDGSHAPPALQRCCPSLVHLLLINTERSSHLCLLFIALSCILLLLHSPAGAFFPVRPQSASSAGRPGDSACCFERLLPPGGSFWERTSSLWVKIHPPVLWAEHGSACLPLSAAGTLGLLLLQPAGFRNQINPTN